MAEHRGPTLKLWPKQHDFVHDTSRYAAFIGGRGCSKSHSGCLKDILYMLTHPGAVGMVCAPTYPILRKATRLKFLELTREVLPRGFVTRYSQQDNVIEFANGSMAWFVSLDDPETARGPNAAFLHVDEAGYVTREGWSVAKATVRQPGYPHQTWITSTPKGRGNFIYDEFVLHPTPRHTLYRARSAENPHLPPDYEESLGYTGVFYRQEILGEFVAFEGLVWPEFARDTHVRYPPIRPSEAGPEPARPVREPRRVVVGVDWGYRDPAVLLVWADYGDGQYHIVEEWYERGKTLDEHIAAATAIRDRWPVEAFVADPSRPDSIAAMRNAGLHVVEAQNDILLGISAVATLFAEGRLLVSPSCIHAMEEYEVYQWPRDKEGRNTGVKPIDWMNHAADCTRYVALYLERPTLAFRRRDVAATLSADLEPDTDLFA